MFSEATLFIHGNLASNNWWKPSQEVFQKLNHSQNTTQPMICAEFRGCGESSAPVAETEVNMFQFAHDYITLVKELMNTKQIQGPVNLVGHSTGGLIAALMLAEAPELFNKAYLLDPVGAEGVRFDSSMIQAFEAMKADKNLTGVVIGSTILNNNAEDVFFKTVLVEDAYKSVKAVGHLVLKALDGLDVREKIKTVKHKVLVVHGDQDVLLPREASEKLASLLPQGQFKLLEGCGHCANIEKPAYFAQSVTDFFKV